MGKLFYVHQDGGQLCLYPDGSSSAGIDNCQMISPVLGRVVLFRSDMEHEVLPAFNYRCNEPSMCWAWHFLTFMCMVIVSPPKSIYRFL